MTCSPAARPERIELIGAGHATAARPPLFLLPGHSASPPATRKAIVWSRALDNPLKSDAVTEEIEGGRSDFAPLLVHIGFHKCGSTWLQQELFNDAASGFTVGEGERRQDIILRLGMPDPLFYDPAEVAADYSRALAAARGAGLTLAISHEQLSGHPSAGGRDRCIIADRIRAAFPDARILIVFREQKALIRSMYSQHITAGGVESLDRWLSTPEPWVGRRPSFRYEFYEFDRLIEYYHGLFGKDRVLALPLELLSRDADGFARRIASFCGQTASRSHSQSRRNVKRPQLMQLVQRPLNLLFFHNDLSPGALVHIPRFHNRWAKFRPLFDAISPGFIERRIERSQSRKIAEAVGTRYAKSNRRTAELTGFPLAEFGYQID